MLERTLFGRLNVTVGDFADVEVVDPTGAITGYDVTDGRIREDVSDSVYLRDALIDDLSGELATETTHTVNITQPKPGTYVVIVNGVGLGTYVLNLRTVAEDRSSQGVISLSGIAGEGSVSTFQFQFDPSPGATTAPVRVATFQAALDDIGNSLTLGIVDNQGVANSLAAKIQAAKDAADRGETQTAVKILTAFKHEVGAQIGNHIQTPAGEVLTQDADSLIQQQQ